MATEIFINGSPIDFQSGWSITLPTSPVDVAPSAEVTTTAETTLSANDTLRIDIDGTTRFEGKTRSGGTVSELGGKDVSASHAARDLFEETVDLSLSSPSTSEVLQGALNAANSGGSFTLDYSGTSTSLGNDYEVEGRSVKRVFRDVMDRTGRVWWVDPAGSTIHVEQVGGRGLWQSLDTTADGLSLRRFDTGNVDTVRNSVTVVGTGDEQVRATASDSTSISNYGRRTGNSPYNVSYITTTSEAQAYADELLVADPLPQGKLVAGSNVGDVVSARVNQTVDVVDDGKNVDVDGLVIESQTIEQGRATLTLGAGAGVSIEEVNRKTKSREDVTEPGSVYGNDRIGDGAVDTPQLVDTAVIESKLDDLAVSLNKIDFDAIDETKIQDDAVTTPKLIAEAVTAAKVQADTLTANEIAAGTITALEIAADTITANQISAGTLTASEIDALDIDTGQLSISTLTPGGELDFVTVDTVNGVGVYVIPTNGYLGDGANPFEQVVANDYFDGNGNTIQSKIDDLQSQINDLESRVSTLESYH